VARYKADTISQLMGHGYWVRILCRCGNNATISPSALMKSHRAVSISTSTRIDELQSILKCKLCGQRPSDVHATFKPE
jgi:hypothetical protein